MEPALVLLVGLLIGPRSIGMVVLLLGPPLTDQGKGAPECGLKVKVSFSVCQGLDRLLQLGLEFGLGLPLGRPIVGGRFCGFRGDLLSGRRRAGVLVAFQQRGWA
jgi:hypothetical protein